MAQAVAVYRGEARREGSETASPVSLAFASLEPGVLNGEASLEAVGQAGNFVGRLDGRILAIVSRAERHHLAWTGMLDPASGTIRGAIRTIPLDGSAGEVWNYQLSPAEAADGVVTALRASDPAKVDTATTGTLDLARSGPPPAPAMPPPPLIGEWEVFTYIDDFPQTRPLFIESVSGTLFTFRLGSFDAPQETGTYDPASRALRFISGGYTHEGRFERNRRGEWVIRGPIRRGTGEVAEATDSRGTMSATRKGDLPK